MFFGMDFVGIPCGHSPLATKMVTEAQQENAITLVEMFNRFSNIAITRMVWTGLPDSVSERFLNMSLYFYGQAAFFNDKEFSYLCLPCSTAGSYNMYYEPTRVNAFSFNINRLLEKDEFVFIRNNPSCTPTAFTVFTCVKRMVDILRTIDVALYRMKRPYILICEEKQRLTYLNAMKKISDNEEVILGNKNFDFKQGTFEKMDMRTDYNLADLWSTYKNIENILYTALGIDSADNEKKERLLVDEVNANVMVTEMSLESTLKELKEACKLINDKYGLNIDVHLKRITDYQGEGGTMDGAIYD